LDHRHPVMRYCNLISEWHLSRLLPWRLLLEWLS
jgi:hypothetical protein